MSFWNLGRGRADIDVNTEMTLGLARAADGLASVFVDGELLFTFLDPSDQAVSASNILNFFVDDNDSSQRESFAGSVDFIRIHDDATTFGATPSINPEPSAIIIWSLLGVAFCWIQRRRRK